MKWFSPVLLLFLTAAPSLAQRATPSPTAASSPDAATEAAAATALAGMFGIWSACCVVYILLIASAVAAWIFTGIWVMRDAKSRNSENAQLVTVLGWIPVTWWIGLIIHLATRPKGNLVPCPNCQKNRLEGSAICPHCGQP